MLDDLTPAQRALAICMSELSKRLYCTVWHSGLEIALWNHINGTPSRSIPDDPKVTEMFRWLSAQAGGWIKYDDEREEVFVPFNDRCGGAPDWVAYRCEHDEGCHGEGEA